jgi:hypothetical protein
MFFVMLTITSRQMCFGSSHKTIWEIEKVCRKKLIVAEERERYENSIGRVFAVASVKSGLSMAMVQRLRALSVCRPMCPFVSYLHWTGGEMP